MWINFRKKVNNFFRLNNLNNLLHYIIIMDNLITCYSCNICTTKPDQLSHHKAHLKTQKHAFQKKCFAQCLEKYHYVSEYFANRQGELINTFENETGLKFNVDTDEFDDWNNKLMVNNVLSVSYPNIITPEKLKPKNDSETWLIENIQMYVEANETVKVMVEQKKICSQVSKEERINRPVSLLDIAREPTEFGIATILYKKYHDKYTCKSYYHGGIWVDKTDTTINCDTVYSTLLQIVSGEIKNTFIEIKNAIEKLSPKECEVLQDVYGTNGKVDVQDIAKFNHVIKLMSKPKFITSIMREAIELFYDN